MKNLTLISFLALSLIITACTPTETVAEPILVEEKDSTSTPNLTPFINLPQTTITPQSDLLRISGDAPTNQTLIFTETTRVRVNWQYNNYSRFIVRFNNPDPAAVDTKYGIVTFINHNGPTNGFIDYEFIAGTYTVEVTEASGPWEVWVEKLP